jgi:dUTP pyrophosphatase
MKVRITRLDKGLPLPKYETDGSVGFDFMARLDTTVEPKSVALIPANVVLEVPTGFMLVVASRSSTPLKRGLLTPHGIGIIDHDYCGPNDEIKIQVYNFKDEAVEIKRGDKVAQGVFVHIDKFDFEETEMINSNDRGGFGSTDK